MHIRKFIGSDIPATSVIYCSCFAEPPWFEAFEPASVAQEMSEVMSWPDAVMVAATDGDRLVASAYGYDLGRKPDVLGMTDASSDAFYLAEVFVDPAARHRGLATDLIKGLLAIAGARTETGVVRTSVDQPIIRHLLLKLGWEIVAEQEVVSEKTVDGRIVTSPDRRIILVGRL